MLLRKLLTILICLFFYSTTFSQTKVENKDIVYALLNNFKFNSISLKYKKTAKYNLWGTEYKTHKFIIKAITSRDFRSESEEKKTFKETYALYVIEDKNGIFRDSLLLFIKDYLKQYEGHYLYPNHIATERNIIIDSLNNFCIYYNTRFDYYDRPKLNDPEFALWMDNKIYCFKTIRGGKGFGKIESFIHQNVKIKNNNSFITISDSGLRWDKFIKLYNEGFFGVPHPE